MKALLFDLDGTLVDSERQGMTPRRWAGPFALSEIGHPIGLELVAP